MPSAASQMPDLVNKVINNIQITVKNIHIRYEDTASVPGVSMLKREVSVKLMRFISSTPSLLA